MKIIYTLLLLLVTDWLSAQEPLYTCFYRVCFRDKGEITTGDFSPEELLSPAALHRREKAGIAVPDFRDLPVNKKYLDLISASGFKLHCTSRWMNTALFKTESLADVKLISALPFVSEVKIVKTAGIKSAYTNKLDVQKEEAGLPVFDRPVTMVDGQPLHDAGYDGKGILIAVTDGGFFNSDKISSLNNLRTRNGIISTRDFVKNSVAVYNSTTHGTAVLSILAGKISGMIEGTAPGADFLLLKTEDIESESPYEEDLWAAGAEYADSAGADIISSSLGYYNFDDPALNYKTSDLDGNTAFITRAADIAASKGILVVNSAGNERDNTWRKIIFPADGDSILTVGAVNGDESISSFSSSGPTADNRIKPDNVSMGVNVTLQTAPEEITRSSGTSFSCPVLSGMTACLMQAVPEAMNTDIIEALHKGADRYDSPDSLYGYGIPDMVSVLKKLQDKYVKIPENSTLAWPNPTTGDVEITFREEPGSLTIEIISVAGTIVSRKVYPDLSGRKVMITDLQRMEQGIYFIRLHTGKGIMVNKIIKIRN